MVITQFHQNIIDNTKPLHDEAEKLPIINKIFSLNVSLDEYTSYLLSMAKVHKKIESSAKKFQSNWNSYGLNIDDYFRLKLINKDLEILNKEFELDDLNDNLFDSFEDSVGFMYVMTGSMMGGRILAKKINAKFQDTLEVLPNNYFLAFNEENPKKWMKFLQTLNNIENNSTQEQKDAITKASINAFKFVTKNLRHC